MSLSDFSTLAAAQAYTKTATSLISSAQMRIFMAATQTYMLFKDATSEMKIIAFDNLVGGDPFNFIVGDPNNISTMFDGIITEDPANAAALTALKGACVAEANKVTYPYVDATQVEFDARDIKEVLAMTMNNSQHSATLSITTMPTKRINVSIQQRYGASNADLTPWHEVASFIGVHYTQQTYRASNISASPAAYRELRAVSEQTLGMSVS